MSIVAQLIANGIIAGSIYALVALGYTMVYGILKFINFAHGEVYMLGAYFAYVLAKVYHVPIVAAFIISMILCAIVGVIIERVAYRPLRKSTRLAPLITAIALSIFLQSLALLVWGSEIRTFRTGEISKGHNILGAIVTDTQLMIIATTIVLMLLLWLFIKKTKLGKAMRATADNLEVAKLIGINTDRVIATVFAIGSALAAAGGILIGIEQNLEPTMGVTIGIKAFTATVVGGIGNIWGAVVGALLIGLVENIGIWFIPSGYKDAIAFVILVIMLIFKPSGIFGSGREEDIRAQGE
ncbi:branched-chain amino acid ABC transporter permease [Candidatus Woesearchaeota archaeon]|jgi:branched-chain amino acid transport system permease protein|nr:branched-chain amino acid ABC transporter permease [Candidatus Woesearchaeota archaeon]MBT3537390.1 branched-chain amino acid ABC transporter permease [Candidatus Woesearchaeota archaeon]MBT4697085.1 branched-chain amino acid ABC transporter permease [Candidatus Woesearchaeota archaeon]MBT4717596.1 branched-chain amino acid ABC transporter permease [Candidatus Woesearchaeota archaeon]MBT7106300.1 branched-chain amino acid ABC transporter permease [Candidatus Woesearchaeota archaeon]